MAALFLWKGAVFNIINKRGMSDGFDDNGAWEESGEL